MRGPFCDKQWDVIHFYNKYQPRHLILEGAIRSGKTYADLLLWYAHIYDMPKPAKDFIITGYTMGSVERNIIQPLAALVGRSITLDQFGRFDMGSHKINCFGTNTEVAHKPMQGMTAYGWLANEITTSHRNSRTEAFQRCSGDGSRIFWDTNPDNPAHPVKLDYVDKSGLRDESGALAIQSFHFVLDDNETLSPEYVADVKRATPKGMWYDRRILGKWVAAEGIIYTNWEEISAIPEEVKNHSYRMYGIDFGFSVHPAVVVDLYYNGEEIWVDELFYKTGCNNYVLGMEMEKLCDRDIPIYADKSEPKSIDELSGFGFNVYPSTGGPDSVRAGIDWLLGKRIYVTQRSKNIIKEFQNYAWRTDKDGEQIPVPTKVYDHCLAGSSIIETAQGWQRIDKMKAGECLTSDGMKNASASWESGNAEILYELVTTGGNFLLATAEHKIKTPDGWKSIDALRYADIIYRTRRPKWECLKSLCSRVFDIADTQNQKTGQIECITGGKPANDYTWPYRKAGMAQCQQTTRYITSIRTPSTMGSKILIALKNVLTMGCIRYHRNGWRRCEKTLIGSETRQRNGTGAQKAGLGIQGKPRNHSKSVNPLKKFVIAAVRHFGIFVVEREADFALMRAELKHGAILGLITLSGCVPFAEKILASINTVRPDVVLCRVLRVREVKGKREIYDAEVDEIHEFFANGILVHNSMDAMRYASSEFIDTFRGRVADAYAGDLGL